MEKLNKNLQDFVYLVSCAINENLPSQNRLSSMDFSAIYNFANANQMINACYSAIHNSSLGLDCISKEELRNRWTDSADAGIRRQMMLYEELQRICDFLQNNKIWYVPMKGAVLEHLYPEFAMRQMRDYDLYVDKSSLDTILNFMTNRGYEVDRSFMHDAYIKKPIYNYEFHTYMFSDKLFKQIYEHFKDVNKRLQNTNSPYVKKLSNEDFYLQVVCHRMNHCRCSIGGIKILCDIYLFWKKYGADMNQKYLQESKRNMQIEEFENRSRSLAFKIFENPDFNEELTEEERKDLIDSITNSENGSLNNYLKNRVNTYKGDPAAFRAYFFPSMEAMYKRGYWYAKHKPLLPAYWVRMYCKRIKEWGFANILKGIFHK